MKKVIYKLWCGFVVFLCISGIYVMNFSDGSAWQRNAITVFSILAFSLVVYGKVRGGYFENKTKP